MFHHKFFIRLQCEQGKIKKKKKPLQNCSYNSHPQSSFLTPVLMRGNNPGCTGEMLHPGCTCSWTAVNAFCSHQQCQRRRQGPSMLGNWGTYSILLCLPWSCNGLERDWGGLWCSGTRQEEGDSVSQWECSSDKQGGKRQGVGHSSCSGLGQRGEGRQKPMAVIHSVSIQLRNPEPAPVLPFCRPKGNTNTCENKILGQVYHICRTLHYPLANPHSFTDSAQTPGGFGKHHWSHGLSQPVQHSEQLRSQEGSGTVTSCSQSRSVMERWNIWFQVMEKLSAAPSFFFFSKILARLFKAKFKWRTVSQVKQIQGQAACYLCCLG